MDLIEKDDLILGTIYITAGGLATVLDTKGVKIKTPWGFDRVKYIKTTDYSIIVETPWGTECVLPLDYKFYTTSETKIRSEFPLCGPYFEKTRMTFKEAIEQGYCKEIIKTKKPKNVKISDSVPPPIISTSARMSTTVNNDLCEKIIKYFEEPRVMIDAAKELGLVYQTLRYRLINFNKKGHNLVRYNLIQSKIDGKKVIQLQKV